MSHRMQLSRINLLEWIVLVLLAKTQKRFNFKKITLRYRWSEIDISFWLKMHLRALSIMNSRVVRKINNLNYNLVIYTQISFSKLKKKIAKSPEIEIPTHYVTHFRLALARKKVICKSLVSAWRGGMILTHWTLEIRM
jgi:hypothetical protein